MFSKMHIGYRMMVGHWTTLTMGVTAAASLLFIMEYRNSFNQPFRRRKMRRADLPNMPDDNLLNLLEGELLAISEKRRYSFERSYFTILVYDDIESKTYGLFACRNEALFRFSTRLALNDIESIQKHYPNLLHLFKANFSVGWVNDLKSVWNNFLSAKSIGDIFTVFREKSFDLNMNVDTSALSDEELGKIILSADAKKFAIAREIQYADSYRAVMPALSCAQSNVVGWLMFSLMRSRLGDKLAISIALIIMFSLLYLIDRDARMNAVTEVDEEIAQMGDSYLAGCKEYLQKSIELGKLLHRLTDGKSRFDVNGDYEDHVVPYTKRLKLIEELERRLNKEKAKKK